VVFSHSPLQEIYMGWNPFFERDATGWQFINIANGHVDLQYVRRRRFLLVLQTSGNDKAVTRPTRL